MARRKRKNKKKLIPIIFLFLILILTGAFGVEENQGQYTNSYLASDDAFVHFIDVGQGSCALIQVGRKGVLIDSGEIDYSESVVDYIKSCGIDSLEYAIISHAHSDHMGSMTEVLDEFPVGRIIMTELTEINIPTTRIYEELLTFIDSNDISVSFCEYGDVYDFEGVSIEIFGPVEQVSDLNDMSVICKVDVGGNDFLFTGDAEKQELKSIMQLFPDVKCDVILMGHHGSKTAVYEEFLDCADAEVAIISCGQNNSYGHPHAETLSYIEDNAMTLYRTDLDGSIVFKCSETGYEKID